MKTTVRQITVKDLLTESKTLNRAKMFEYTAIWRDMNALMIDRCILDGVVDTPLMGKFKIIRFKPNIKILENGFASLPVSWAKTKQARKAGTLDQNKVIYANPKQLFKISWHRPITIRGIKGYGFKPSRSNGVECKSGFLNKLYVYIKENETNYLRFPLKK
jgi:hypothetical protein